MQNGQIITCYSYKGGVGRSFALANVAVILAQWKLRVLCIDWDLEAPGLDYYLGVNEVDQPGLLEMVEDVRDGRAVGPLQHVFPASRRGDDLGVDLISAGRPAKSYTRRLQDVDWERLYAKHDFGNVLEEWRDAWRRKYDVVLIDSRTGVTDVGGICTAQLPDILLLFFTANHQGVDGVLKVREQAIRARNGLPFDRAPLLTVPIPSRIDQAVEYERTEKWREIFQRSFEPCYHDWVVKGVDLTSLMGYTTIPYSAYWSFGEELPALVEGQREPSYVTYPLATLAALLAHRLDKTDLLATSRDSFVDAASRIGNVREGFSYDVFISSTRENAEEGIRLGRLLTEAGLKVSSWTNAELGQGSSWSEEVSQLLASSQHLVALLGGEESRGQLREIEFVLRQSLDDLAERRIIPIMTSSSAGRHAPSLVRSLQSIDLTRGSTLEDAAGDIAEIVATTQRRAPQSQPQGPS